jgi:hypothetical protein
LIEYGDDTKGSATGLKKRAVEGITNTWGTLVFVQEGAPLDAPVEIPPTVAHFSSRHWFEVAPNMTKVVKSHTNLKTAGGRRSQDC